MKEGDSPLFFSKEKSEGSNVKPFFCAFTTNLDMSTENQLYVSKGFVYHHVWFPRFRILNNSQVVDYLLGQSLKMWPLKWSFLMSGIFVIEDKNPWVHRVMKVYRFLLLVLIVIDVWESVYKKEAIKFSRNVINGLFSFITLIFFWRYEKQFQELFQIFSKQLRARHRKKLFWLSFKLFLWKCFNVIFFTLPYLIYRLFHIWKTRRNIKVVLIAVVIKQVHSWSHLVVTIFLQLLTTLDCVEGEKIRHITKQVNEGNKSAESVYKEVRETTVINDKVMKTMSLLPCMYFLYVFTSSIFLTVRVLLGTKKQNSSTEFPLFSILSITYLICLVLEMSCLCIEASKFCDRLRERLETLEEAIALCPQIDKKDWFYVFDQIREAKAYKFKAWKFFSIDQSMLLSITGSLVSFTVLFVQILVADKR
jgi:hypothetical protein